MFALVPLVYISIQFYTLARDNLTKKVLSDLAGTAERQENHLESRLAQRNERLVFIQSRSSIVNSAQTMDSVSLHNALKDAKESNNHFKDISILDLNGKVIGSTNAMLIGSNMSDEEFFDSSKEKNSVDIMFKDSDGSSAGYLAGPVKNGDKTLGVLLIKTDNDTILSWIKDYAGFGQTGEIILVGKDSNGKAIALTPLRFKPDAAFNLSWDQGETSFPAYEALNGIESTFTNTRDYRSAEVLAATRQINGTNWGIIVKKDQSEAFAPLTDLQNRLALRLIVVATIIFFGSRYLAHILTKPLLNLRETAENLSRGDLSARANIYGEDEFGQLAKTFNRMANEIEITFNLLRDKVRETRELQERLIKPEAKEEVERLEKQIQDLKEKLT